MVLELFARSSGRDRFPVVRRGYDPTTVDVFLDALEHWDPNNPTPGSPSPAEVRDKMFPVVKRGYDRARVHRHMYSLATPTKVVAGAIEAETSGGETFGGDMEQLAA